MLQRVLKGRIVFTPLEVRQLPSPCSRVRGGRSPGPRSHLALTERTSLGGPRPGRSAPGPGFKSPLPHQFLNNPMRSWRASGR